AYIRRLQATSPVAFPHVSLSSLSRSSLSRLSFFLWTRFEHTSRSASEQPRLIGVVPSANLINLRKLLVPGLQDKQINSPHPHFTPARSSKQTPTLIYARSLGPLVETLNEWVSRSYISTPTSPSGTFVSSHCVSAGCCVPTKYLPSRCVARSLSEWLGHVDH
ncbi:hypothetical protein CTAM01_10527, partial [Colletotrichum tamarilloi]